MEVILNRELVGIDGKALETEDKKKLVLKEVMVRSLLGDFPDETTLAGEEKVRRYQLAMKIMKAETKVDISIEDLALTKKQIAKMYGVLVCAQAWEMLEGK